jgi:hypothetical protein
MALPAGSFGSSNIRFRVIFDVYNAHLSFTDLIGTAYNSYYSETLSNIRAKVKVTSPTGTVFYNDLTPVITGAGTPVWTISNIDLPTDVDGVIESGNYTVQEWVSVDGGATYPFTYTKVALFDYVAPAASLVSSADVYASTLTLTDATAYNVTHDGDAIVPTKTRSMVINYPRNPVTNTPVASAVTTTLSTYTISNIYSRTYEFTLNTTCSWSFEDWDTSYTSWLVVTDSVLGESHLTVTADTCMCNYYNCIATLQLSMDAVKDSNFKEYQTLRAAETALNDYIIRYLLAKQCGENSQYWCDKIKEILLQTTPCDCAEDTNVPTLIVPVGGGGGTVVNLSNFKFTFGAGSSGFPSSPTDGDVHAFTDTSGGYSKGDIYKYIVNAWVFQYNNMGATGVGVAGADGKDGHLYIHNDIADVGTDAGTNEKTLKTYSVPSNILGVNGDVLIFESVFTLGHNASGKTVRQSFGGDNVVEYFCDSLIGDDNDDVRLTTLVSRISANSQLVESSIERKGGYINSPIITTAAKDCTGAITVAATGQNSVATLNDIVCKAMRVSVGKLLTSTPVVYSAYEKGIGIPVTAYVPYSVTFSTAFPNNSYYFDVTIRDSNGTLQTAEITNITIYGFTVTSPVNGTLNWKAEL